MQQGLAGQYYSASESEIINLAAVTRLWQDGDEAFSTRAKLCFTSCGQDYDLDSSPKDIANLFSQLENDGSFVKIGENFLNTKSLQSVCYDGKEIEYQIAGETKSEPVEPYEAKDIMDRLEKLTRFQRIDDHLVNMNKVINMWFEEGGWFSDDRLEISFLGDSQIDVPMSKQDAERIQNEASRRPQFQRVGGEILNLVMAGHVWEEKGTLHVGYPVDTCIVKMGDGAKAAKEHFSSRLGYLTFEGQKINPQIISNAWEKEEGVLSSPKLEFNILDDDYYYIKMEPSRVKSAITELKKNGDFVDICGEIYNINSIGCAFYDGKSLSFTQGAEDYSEKMEEHKARAILDTILVHEKFIEIDGGAVNIQFASCFEYEKGCMQCVLGQDVYDFKVSDAKAKKIFDQIREFGLEKESKLNELRNSSQGKEGYEAVWDADLLAEIYEEIDTMHTTNTLLMTAVTLSIVNNSMHQPTNS